jgi:hypothetical protein
VGLTELEADSEDARRTRHDGSDCGIIGEEEMDLALGVWEPKDHLLNLKKGNLNKSKITLKSLRTLELEP